MEYVGQNFKRLIADFARKFFLFFAKTSDIYPYFSRESLTPFPWFLLASKHRKKSKLSHES